eukprot:TRINITY_DN4335_c0_g1_i1.p1 TRINITY_DN4335_c0_g1~~TRINITY_DN4335_c0_g1_i1.p1  ORF type:complete len:397 (-),score=45.40 TRINITY_DN4335_c0_g1_i1:37-1227(-)
MARRRPVFALLLFLSLLGAVLFFSGSSQTPHPTNTHVVDERGGSVDGNEVTRTAAVVGGGVQPYVDEDRHEAFTLAASVSSLNSLETSPFPSSCKHLVHFHESLHRSTASIPRVCNVKVIEFPKCGRTWLVTMLEATINSLQPSFITSSATHQCSSERETGAFMKFSRSHGQKKDREDGPNHPFAMKPAELGTPLALLKSKSPHPALLLVRDPRDAIVSSYFERTERDRHHRYPSTNTISTFLREETGSLATLLAFQQMWVAFAQTVPDSMTIVRYEDLKRCSANSLKHLLQQWNYSPSMFRGGVSTVDAAVLDVADRTSFERMHQQEAVDSVVGSHGKLTAGDINKPESFKTRKGSIGGYTEYLTDEDVRYIEERIREHPLVDKFLGYGTPGGGA